MSGATVQVTPVFTNGPTGELLVTVTSDDFGDSLHGYIRAEDVMHQARRALRLDLVIPVDAVEAYLKAHFRPDAAADLLAAAQPLMAIAWDEGRDAFAGPANPYRSKV